MIIQGRKISKGKYEVINTDTLEYCQFHKDKIKFKEGSLTNKDGTIEKFRFCPKCYQTIK